MSTALKKVSEIMRLQNEISYLEGRLSMIDYSDRHFYDNVSTSIADLKEQLNLLMVEEDDHEH